MDNTLIQSLKDNVKQVIIGKDDVIELLLTTLVAGGNCLIDDVPGMGKTKLANALAQSIGVDCKRIQFTPDLQPADITGMYYYNQKTGDFQFRSGPVFTNILLADEINRAVPRTQASLLEAMEEHQVSIEGQLFRLEAPFMVIATQNPVELEGTFPLPEAQLDRFLLKVEVGYPTLDQEVAILNRFKGDDPLTRLQPVATGEDILKARTAAEQVKITSELVQYIANLAAATREKQGIRLGLSPRGSLALLRSSLAYAYVQGRTYTLPDDIKYLFPYVATHRIILDYEISYGEDLSKEELLGEILQAVPVPTEDALHG